MRPFSFKLSRRLLQTAAGAACVIAIAGCAGNLPATTAVNSPLASPPNPAMQSPIPVVATQMAGLGRVTGILLLKTPTGTEPQPGRLLYLAEVITDANGKQTAVGYDRTSAPRATTGPDGAFTFANVPAGKYGLVNDVVTQAFMLKDPVSGGDLLIDVKADVVTDFGTLTYQELPR